MPDSPDRQMIGRELIDRAQRDSAKIDSPSDALDDAGIVVADLLQEARFCAGTYSAGGLGLEAAVVASYCVAFELGVRCAALRAE